MKRKMVISSIIVCSMLIACILYFGGSYKPSFADDEHLHEHDEQHMGSHQGDAHKPEGGAPNSGQPPVQAPQGQQNSDKGVDQHKDGDKDHDKNRHRRHHHRDDDTITITTYEPAEQRLPEIALSELPYDLVVGKADAPVTIIEYSSLACPHCATFHKDVYPRIKLNFIDTGIARYIYRDFPTNPAALTASMMAICSGDKRAVLLNTFFETQSLWIYTPNFRQSLANIAALGALNNLDDCMADKSLQEQILKKAYIAGSEYGVNATPMFFVNGRSVGSPNSYDDWNTLIRDAQSEANG